MSDYFLGEIRLFPFKFAPEGWHVCDGTLLPVQQNAALFSLLSYQFGGNQSTTFALPDLRGRTPVHLNRSLNDNDHIITGVVGSSGGSDSVTLAANQVPDHTHAMYATTNTGTLALPATTTANIPATPGHSGAITQSLPIYIKPANSTAQQHLSVTAVSPLGAAVGHENRQPYLTGTYCIATLGIYPPRD